jgi:DNA-binding transcriptional ArsR family regulator
MGKKPGFSQAESMTISDRETVKVVLNPTRTRLITALAQEERTVKELSTILGQEQTKLYYHIKLLLKAGIIVAVGERQIGNLTETSYVCAAKSYTVDPAIAEGLDEEGGPESTAASFISMLRSSLFASCRRIGERKKEKRAGADEEARKEAEAITMLIETFRLGKGEAKEFVARLQSLIAEFESRNAGEESSPFYELGFALFPSASDPKAQETPAAGKTGKKHEQSKGEKNGI